jgi:hypothetical protein
MKMEFENENEQQQMVFHHEPEDEQPEQTEAPDLDDIDDDIEVPEEDQQLDLFGEPAEPVSPSPKAQSNSKPKKKNSKNKLPEWYQPPKPDEKVSTEFTVYYAGHRIPVPEDNMTLESLREFLEGDFPELSKERTEMTIDREKKQVVPIVKGAKKG